MTIKHKCNCGAEAEFSGDELCDNNIFSDVVVTSEYRYQVEWLAARWLQLHDTCRQLGLINKNQNQEPEIHKCRGETWRPYSEIVCSCCPPSGKKAIQLSTGEMCVRLNKLEKVLMQIQGCYMAMEHGESIDHLEAIRNSNIDT